MPFLKDTRSCKLFQRVLREKYSPPVGLVMALFYVGKMMCDELEIQNLATPLPFPAISYGDQAVFGEYRVQPNEYILYRIRERRWHAYICRVNWACLQRNLGM